MNVKSGTTESRSQNSDSTDCRNSKSFSRLQRFPKKSQLVHVWDEFNMKTGLLSHDVPNQQDNFIKRGAEPPTALSLCRDVPWSVSAKEYAPTPDAGFLTPQRPAFPQDLLSTEDDDMLKNNGFQWFIAAIAFNAGDLANEVDAVHNFAEDGMAVIEVRCRHFGNEEL